MEIHDGHRARLRARYRAEGLDSFNEINALELILFYGIPRRDTNVLAHQLLQRFGSLTRVLDASVEELCSVSGITENAALLLHLLRDFDRFRLLKSTEAHVITNTQDAGKYLMPFFYGCRNEVLYVLCLDAKGKVLACRQLFEGGFNAASISVRRIVEAAMAVNATSVIIAHNHPGGLAIPSVEDETATQRIWSALNSMDIVLLDHLIIADDDYVSMADSGLFCRLRE